MQIAVNHTKKIFAFSFFVISALILGLLNIDVSYVEASTFDPYIEVYPQYDEIWGWEWSRNTTVTISIGSQSWKTDSDSDGWFYWNSPIDIIAGQMITVSDETYTRTHVVKNVTVTSINEATDVLNGTADLGPLSVYAWGDDGPKVLNLVADGSVHWSADFAGLVDITKGTNGWASQYDAEGNSTNVDWFVPNPYIVVYPLVDEIKGYEWLPNTTVTISIGGQYWTEESDSIGWFYWYSPIDIVAGQTVTVTDGTDIRTHLVKNVTVTSIDVAADGLTGTSDPGQLEVGACTDNGVWHWLRTVADDSRNWSAYFRIQPDITEGTFGYVYQYDAEGNATGVYWFVPYSIYMPIIAK